MYSSMVRLCIAAAVASLISAYLYLGNENAGAIDFTRRDYWSQRVTAEGPEKAYEEARSVGPTLPPTKQHRIGHIVGDLLYEKLGERAMTVCDSSLLYGCYHQVVTRVLLDQGSASTERLIAQCPHNNEGAIAIGCEHGIGHGLLAYFGYSLEGLRSAIAHCPPSSAHTSRDEFFGCVQGIFMEFNFNTMLPKPPRVFDFEHPLAPCSEVPKSAQLICIFMNAHWWEATVPITAPRSSLADLGEICSANTRTNVEQYACYGGLGYGAPDIGNFNPGSISTLCTSASSDARNQAACLSCAAYTMAGIDSTTLPTICAPLTGSAYEQCLVASCNPAALSTL